MCKICEQVKSITGKDVTEDEAKAIIQEKAAAMHALKEPLLKETVDFVNAMREKYGEGTFPPLMGAMALIVGSTVGKIPDDHVRAGALMEVFGQINEGVNISLGHSDPDAPDDAKKQIAFNVEIAQGNTNELKELIAARAKANERDAKTVFEVKPPVFH